MNDASDGEEWRRQRRAWIRANHPDAGGDPIAFARELRRFDRASGDHERNIGDSAARGRATVYRSRSPWRSLRRMARAVKRSRQAARRGRSGRVV